MTSTVSSDKKHSAARKNGRVKKKNLHMVMIFNAIVITPAATFCDLNKQAFLMNYRSKCKNARIKIKNGLCTSTHYNIKKQLRKYSRFSSDVLPLITRSLIRLWYTLCLSDKILLYLSITTSLELLLMM